MTKHGLVYFAKVWPDVSHSAASVRVWMLLEALQDLCRHVTLATPSQVGLMGRGIHRAVTLRPNDSPALAAELSQPGPLKPATTMAVFDRFMMEEMFSHGVREHQPGALRVLDTQDLHFLRKWRQEQQRGQGESESMTQLLASFPGAHHRHQPHSSSPEPAGTTTGTTSANAALLRELAAIHRSDMSIVTSRIEYDLLRREYGVSETKLLYLPFLHHHQQHDADPRGTNSNPPHHHRDHFFTIGNWLHQPNADAVEWLQAEIWPRVRQHLPHAELHVYGSHDHATPAVLRRAHGQDGFRLCGKAPDVSMMTRYRACLAPLRFGAGLKGKIFDAWTHGTPVVTTPVGGEGMTFAEAVLPLLDDDDDDNDGYGGSGTHWGGMCTSTDPAGLAEDAVRLYRDQDLWRRCQATGTRLLRALFDRDTIVRDLQRKLGGYYEDLEQNRNRDFTQALLWQTERQHTTYFSRWIELKESLRVVAQAQREESGG